jgi:glycosyltransferase involved in cell wall biosynthesis
MILSEIFDVTLAIVGNLGSEAEAHEELATDVKRACTSVLVIHRTSAIHRILRRTSSRRARLLLEALWPTPLYFAHYWPAIAELAKRLAGQNFDVVHCFRLNTGVLLLLRRRGINFCRSVLDFDMYESQSEFRSIRTFRTLVGNGLSVVNWLKAAKWWMLEALLIPSFDDGVVCSQSDQQRLCRRFRRTRWHVVPNIVPEPRQVTMVKGKQFTFLFVGQLGYLPNWDAVLFFCMQVIPILRRNAPGKFRVLIVGRPGGDPDLLAGIEEVQMAVNPPDLLPYYTQSDVVIVPLRGGGGTRVKVLEAFAYGLPVVCTSIGAEGLDVTAGSDIIIADTAETFANECTRVWSDADFRCRIATAGRNLWRRKYSVAALADSLDALYQEAKQITCSAKPTPRSDLKDEEAVRTAELHPRTSSQR